MRNDETGFRDLVHHVLHDIPDPGVKTWLEESTPKELAGLEKLLSAAREFGYDDDGLADPPSKKAAALPCMTLASCSGC